MSREDSTDYAPSWTPHGNITDPATFGAHEQAYLYLSEKELKGSFFWGYLHTYGGGGYVANLGNTETEAAELVTQLKESGWVDQYTRAILLEFNVWNANTNLFNLFSLSVEFPNFGSSFSWRTIRTVQLYRYNAAAGVLALFAEIGLIIFVLVMGVFEGKKIYKQRRKYFSSLWNVLQFALIMIFLAAFVSYVMRSLKTKTTVEEMMNNRGRLPSYTKIQNLLFI